MPVRTPSKWNSEKGQAIVSDLDSGKTTREDAIKEAVRKLDYKNATDASRALSQFLNYRSKESREKHSERLRAIKAGQKGRRVSLDPAVTEAMRSIETQVSMLRQFCSMLGADTPEAAVARLRELINEKEALVRDKTTLLAAFQGDRAARAGSAKGD